MSLLADTQTVTIRRFASSDAGWGADVAPSSYTVAARGNLAQSWGCEIQPMTGTETTQFGVTASDQAFEFFGTTDPQVDTRDVFDFTLNGREYRNCCVSLAEDVAGQGRQWRIVGIIRGAAQ